MYALGAERSDLNRPQGEVLLKTPTSQLAVNGGSQHPDKRKAGGHGPTLADEVEHLLPTPLASDGEKMSTTYSRGNPTLRGALQLLPTPQVADVTGGHKTRSGKRSNELLLPGVAEALSGAHTPPPSSAGSGAWGVVRRIRRDRMARRTPIGSTLPSSNG